MMVTAQNIIDSTANTVSIGRLPPPPCAAIASLKAYQGLVPMSPKTTPSEAMISAGSRCPVGALMNH
jgi:hypothetical protein